MTSIRQDQELEKEIQEKGLTAPRITLDQIDALMGRMWAFYEHIGTSTFCHMFLDGKFYVATGHSACVSPENFNEGIGRKVAFDNAGDAARKKLWEMEGYRLYHSLNKEG